MYVGELVKETIEKRDTLTDTKYIRQTNGDSRVHRHTHTYALTVGTHTQM